MVAVPAGRHANEVPALTAALLEKLREQYLARVQPTEGTAAFATVLSTLARTGSAAVYLRFSRKLDFEGKGTHQSAKAIAASRPELSFEAPESLFSDSLAEPLEKEIASDVELALNSMLTRNRELVVSFLRVSKADPLPAHSPVIFDISYSFFPGDKLFVEEGSPKAYLSLGLDWTLDVRAGDAPPAHFAFVSEPGRFRCALDGGVSEDRPLFVHRLQGVARRALWHLTNYDAVRQS